MNIGLHQVGGGLDGTGEKLAVRVQDDPHAPFAEGPRPGKIGVRRSAGGQTSRNNGDITGGHPCKQGREQSCQVIRLYRRAGLIDVCVGMAAGINDLEVGAGFAGNKVKEGLNPKLL